MVKWSEILLLCFGSNLPMLWVIENPRGGGGLNQAISPENWLQLKGERKMENSACIKAGMLGQKLVHCILYF